MQDLDSFNGQESLNPALMLTLGCWCYSHCCNFTQYFNFALDLVHKCNRWVHFWAKAASSHDMTQEGPKKSDLWWKRGPSHTRKDRQMSVQKVKPTHLCDTLQAQVQHRWISQSSCQEPESLCLNRPDTVTYVCRIWLVPSPQLEISWQKQELWKWWRV